MRKLVSLGLLALSFIALGNLAFADRISECDSLKSDESAPKGLFGLCIAYHNSDVGPGQDRIRDLYERKASANGYPITIPGTAGDCPCWTDTAILAPASEAFGVTCGSASAAGGLLEHDYIIYSYEGGAQYDLGFYAGFAIDHSFCRIQDSGVKDPDLTITEDQEVDCRAMLQEAAAHLPGCP